MPVCLGLSTNYNSSELEADWGICMSSSCKNSSAENPKGPLAMLVYSNSLFFISLLVWDFTCLPNYYYFPSQIIRPLSTDALHTALLYPHLC